MIESLRKHFTSAAVAVLALLGCDSIKASNTITLAWNPSSSPTVAGYLVVYGTNGSSFGSQLNAGLTNLVVVSNLQNATTYYFEVLAYDANNNQSPPTGVITYTTGGSPAPVTYTVTATAGANGAISPSGLQTVDAGTNASFSATPATGYDIAQWLLNGTVVQNGGSSYLLTNVSANDSVAVTFAAEPTVTVAANPAGAGTVTGNGTYAPGATATVSASANSGYGFANWSANGIAQSASPSFSFAVASNVNLVANFTNIPVYYTVSASAGIGGTITLSGSQTVLAGANITFSASPANGYYVGQWLLNGAVVQTGGASYTLANISANDAVSVSFSANPAVSVSVSPSGAGSVTGAGIYAPNSTATVTATANSGYGFANWTENGVVQGTSPNLTLTVVSNVALVANFTNTIVTYTVTATAGTNGIITPNGSETVVAGTNVTFSATANSGYHVNQWLVNGAVVQTGGASYTLANISANDSVTVSFNANPTVTVSANPANAGAVSGAGSYVPGSTATITAAANSGYGFANWTENGIVQSTSPNLTLTVTSNVALVANFTNIPVYYTVTAAAGTNGTVSPSGTQTALAGTNLTFAATPANGYYVGQWLLNGTVVQTGGASYTLANISANDAVSVSFSANPAVSVSVSPSGAGNITGAGSYALSSTATVTATANSGYGFANWTENGIVQSTSPNLTLTVTSNIALVANFTNIPVYYTVTATAGTNGTVSPNGTQMVLAGTNLTFTATPANGYYVGQWLLNGAVVQTGGASYTLANISANGAVSVSFSANPAVSVSVSPSGAGNVTGAGSYALNSTATVNATANSGYGFANWTENGIVQSTSPNLTLTVASNVTLVANFTNTIVTYTVTATAGTNGTISPNGSETVVSGTNVTFSATANSGYHVNQWLLNGAVVQTGGTSYTLANVSANDGVIVSFSANPTVTVSANPANAGAVNGAGSYAPSSTATVTATANSGYGFANWTENGIVQSASPNLTLTVTSNIALVANFTNTIVTYTVTATAGTNGTVSPNGSETVVAGTNVTFSATANSGYHVNQWLLNGAVVQSGGASYTLANVSANESLNVSFAVNTNATTVTNTITTNAVVTYLVTASAETNGSITPSGTLNVDAGSNITFFAAATNGYHVDQWLVNGVVAQTGGDAYTLANILSNQTVSISFATNVVTNVLTNIATNTTGGPVAVEPPSTAGAHATTLPAVSVTNFTLVISGNGTVAPYRKGEVFQTGKKYTLTAVPAKNYIFANWISNGVSVATTAKYSFIAEPTLMLEASFVPNPFTPVAGTYRGLFYNTNAVSEQSSGSFQATVTSSGAFAARILMPGAAWSISGKFSASGEATETISRPGASSLTVQLQLDWTNGLSGTISEDGWVAALVADRAIYSAANHAPQAGKYTLLIPGSTNSSQPGGNSIGAVTVSETGAVTFRGILGDGTPVSAASDISGQGQWPLYISLYNGKGSILGWVNFTNDTVNGDVAWFKLPQANGKTYAGGFGMTNEIIGSSYNPSAVSGDAVVSVSGGNLDTTITNQSASKLTVSASTGLFQGSIANPATGKPLAFNGVILQNQNLAVGLFVNDDATGSVALSSDQ